MDKNQTHTNAYDEQEFEEFTPVLDALRKDAALLVPRKELLSEILSTIDARAPARVRVAPFWRFALPLGAVGVAAILLMILQAPSPQSQRFEALPTQAPFAAPSAVREDAAISPETSIMSSSPSLAPDTTASTTPLEHTTQP